MTKFITPEGAAYEIAPGISQEDAADLGLAIVEFNMGTTPPTPIYGRYKNAPDGGPLGITINKPSDSEIIGGGGVAAPAADLGGGKGEAFKPVDPVVHAPAPGVSIHADGAPPGVKDAPGEVVHTPAPAPKKSK